MRWQRKISIVLLGLGIFATVPASSPAAQDAASEMPKNSMYVIHLPAALTPREFERYVNLLTLSEAQANALRSIYENQYLAKRRELEGEQMPPLIQASRKASVATVPGEMTLEHATLYDEFANLEGQAAQKLIAIEQPLFDLLAAMLSDSQRELLPRVLAHRERTRCTLIFREVPAARIDLSRLVEFMELDPETMGRIDAIMGEYEQFLTPLTVRLDKLCRRWVVERYWLLLQHKASGLNTPEQIEGYMSKKRLKSRPISELQLRIARLNSLYINNLIDVLPEPVGERLKQLYLQQAYPKIYPDTERPEKEYAAVLKQEHLSPEARAAAEDLWHNYLDQHEIICAKMRKAEDQWIAKVSLTEDWTGFPDHRAWMQAMRDRRRGLDQSTRENLNAFMTTEEGDKPKDTPLRSKQ